MNEKVIFGATKMFAIAYITAGNKTEAEKIGETIVKERLAACANIFPEISSIYWWQEKMEKEKEAALFLKTTAEKIPEIIKRVEEIHSYDVPCIIAFSVMAGNQKYLDWIVNEVKK